MGKHRVRSEPGRRRGFVASGCREQGGYGVRRRPGRRWAFAANDRLGREEERAVVSVCRRSGRL